VIGGAEEPTGPLLSPAERGNLGEADEPSDDAGTVVERLMR
jgi:hypothetical protein